MPKKQLKRLRRSSRFVSSVAPSKLSRPDRSGGPVEKRKPDGQRRKRDDLRIDVGDKRLLRSRQVELVTARPKNKVGRLRNRLSSRALPVGYTKATGPSYPLQPAGGKTEPSADVGRERKSSIQEPELGFPSPPYREVFDEVALSAEHSFLKDHHEGAGQKDRSRAYRLRSQGEDKLDDVPLSLRRSFQRRRRLNADKSREAYQEQWAKRTLKVGRPRRINDASRGEIRVGKKSNAKRLSSESLPATAFPSRRPLRDRSKITKVQLYGSHVPDTTSRSARSYRLRSNSVKEQLDVAVSTSRDSSESVVSSSNSGLLLVEQCNNRLDKSDLLRKISAAFNPNTKKLKESEGVEGCRLTLFKRQTNNNLAIKRVRRKIANQYNVVYTQDQSLDKEAKPPESNCPFERRLTAARTEIDTSSVRGRLVTRRALRSQGSREADADESAVSGSGGAGESGSGYKNSRRVRLRPILVTRKTRKGSKGRVRFNVSLASSSKVEKFRRKRKKPQSLDGDSSDDWNPCLPEAGVQPIASTTRPSRKLVRPARYLDSLDTSKDSLAIMRLHQINRGKSLPYCLSDLQWNSVHTKNTQNVYCYCGNGGNWFSKMVQCVRCEQWFHERCLAPRPLSMPILYGDMFYIFVCSNCNHGSECLKKMPLTWVDLVHLALFDLTLKTSRKFHDFDRDLVPFCLFNWPVFQLPKEMNLSKENIGDKVKHVLADYKERFTNGREERQRESLWGLRLLVPPPRPRFKIPEFGIVSERTVLDEVTVHQSRYDPNAENIVPLNKLNVLYDQYQPVKRSKARQARDGKGKRLKTRQPVNGAQKGVDGKKLRKKRPVPEKGKSSHVISSKKLTPFQIQAKFLLNKRKQHGGKMSFPIEKVKLKVRRLRNSEIEVKTKLENRKLRSQSKLVEEPPKSQGKHKPDVRRNGVLKENLAQNLTVNKKSLQSRETRKPLPFEISESLYRQGYPKVAVKFASVIPLRKESFDAATSEAKKKEEAKPKKKKTHSEPKQEAVQKIDVPDGVNLLDAMIPAPNNYLGPNNPFNMGSVEQQRQARNLICNRRLQKEDLTKWRSRIKKRKHRLRLEESRLLWRSRREAAAAAAQQREGRGGGGDLSTLNASSNGIVKPPSQVISNHQVVGRVLSYNGKLKYLMES